MFKELATAFPWYDKIEKQARYIDRRGEDFEIYKLITPLDALLPFEFYTATGSYSVNSWAIYNLDGTLVMNLPSSQWSRIRSITRAGRKYWYYNGAQITPGGGVLTLDPGKYFYSRVGFTNGTFKYSEVFYVPQCSFAVGFQNEFLQLIWYNESDIAPIFYNDLVNAVPYFTNVVYLDTFVHQSEPEIEQESDGKDGNGEDIITFQKAIIRHRITENVPDYLKTALTIAPIHDHLLLATNLENGEIFNPKVDATVSSGGAYAAVSILFETTIAMIKKGCADNML